MKEQNSIPLWRLVFTVAIAAFHFDNLYGITAEWGFVNGSYIAVEFFFMVSGYLLAAHVAKKREQGVEETPLSYLLGRLERLYPSYILSLLLCLGIIAAVYGMGPGEAAEKAADNFWEFVLLQSAGLDRGFDMIHPIAWYVSALLITSFFLHGLLVHGEKAFFALIGPGLALVGYSYLYRYVGSLDAVVGITGIYQNHCLIRSFADMSLGVLIWRIRRERGGGEKHPEPACALLFGSVLAGSFLHGCTRADFVYAFLLFFGVFYAFAGRRRPLPRWILGLSDLSYEVYLIHHPLRMYVFPIWIGRVWMPGSTGGKLLMLCAYLAVSFAGACLLKRLSGALRKAVLRR